MTIPDPFKSISNANRKRALACFCALSLALMVAMQWLDAHLKTHPAPHGIVSFELAGNSEDARHIISSWGQKGQLRAALSLGLDYFFLVAYALLIALACAQIAKALRRGSRRITALGFLLAWLQIPAAMSDAIENTALIQVLLGSNHPAWPAVAGWCAVIKFSLVGAGLLYIAAAAMGFLAIRVLQRHSGSKHI